jgi:hypothetical protein
MATYSAVTNENQGSFNNPRQKMWAVMNLISSNWQIVLITNCFDEAKNTCRSILNAGGVNAGIDKIMVVEIVPIDTVVTPSV